MTIRSKIETLIEICSKIETLIEYAKFGKEITKVMMAKPDVHVELPRAVSFISTSYSSIHRTCQSISSKYPLEFAGKSFTTHASSCLRSVKFLKTIAIPAEAFINVTSLESVEFPSAESVGASAFSNCTSLRELYLPNVTTMGQDMVLGSGIVKASLPKLINVPYRGFYNCPNLEELYLDSLETATTDAFKSCPKLKKLILGKLKSLSYSYSESKELEYIGVAKDTAIGIALYNNPNITQECLHDLIENFADMTHGTAPLFHIGQDNIDKIDAEHISMLENKNFNYK